jgi:hypothetical protein
MSISQRALLVAVFAFSACGGTDSGGNSGPTAKADETKPSAAAPAKPPGRDASSACNELGQGYCERTPVPCDAMKELLARAQLDDDACTRGLEQLLVGDKLGRDLRSAAHLAALEELVRANAVGNKSAIDAAIAEARGAAGKAADEALKPGDIVCPGVATKKGVAPPEGDEVWCEKGDGTRHGDASKWNAKGELVRTTAYAGGKLVEVEYHQPASGELPMSLFVCPEGEKVVADKVGNTDVRSCNNAEGQSGIALFWKGDRLSSISVTARDGEFPGYMEVKE